MGRSKRLRNLRRQITALEIEAASLYDTKPTKRRWWHWLPILGPWLYRKENMRKAADVMVGIMATRKAARATYQSAK